MFSLATLMPFFLALLALQLTPGPDMLLIVGRGVGQGRRVAILASIGATLLAGLIQLPLLALGVASLLQRSEIGFEVLRWAGAVYLIWLGVKILAQSSSSRTGAKKMAPVADWTAMREGMASNLSNPKAWIFMLAFLPQFVDPNSEWSVSTQLLALGAMQKLSGFTVLSLVAFGAGGLGNWLSERPDWVVWQQRFTAAVFVGIGTYLILGTGARPARL